MVVELETEADGPARMAALVMRHRAELFAYLVAAVRHPQDAEDLLQDTCAAAARSWEQFVPGTPFMAWAREIARRRILEHARATRRRPTCVDPEVLARLDAAAVAIEAAEPADARRDALRECVSGLGGVARRVIDLRYRLRLWVPDIASAIGKSVQSTYAILKRARQALRECADRRLKESLS